MTIAFCRGCQGRMIWGLIPAGKKMPVDSPAIPLSAAPATAPIYRVHLVRGDVQFTKVDRSITPPGALVYVSHFATCPERETFSKGGRK